MTAVERLVGFMHLPEEAPAITDTRPPENWPHSGQIQISNLSLRYRPGLPLVLDRMNLDISGGEKVGLCGRTVSCPDAGCVFESSLEWVVDFLCQSGGWQVLSRASLIPHGGGGGRRDHPD